MTALLAWLAKEGVGLLLGALGKLALDAFKTHQANTAMRQLGAAQAANEANVKTLEIQDAVESVPRPSDDAVADRLRSRQF